MPPIPLFKHLLFLVIFLAAAPLAHASPASVRLEHSTASLISEAAMIAPATPFKLGIHIQLEEGWHTYAENPGDAGIPPMLAWNLPPGFTHGPIIFPPHATFMEGALTTYGYGGEVIFPIVITPPPTLPAGPYTFMVKAEYLVCKDICIPQTAELAITLTGGKALVPSEDAPRFAPSPPAPGGSGLGLALLLAFTGGVILNLMPCVFPVLSLKALKIAKYAGKEQLHIRAQGLAYTGGILLCFLLIAGLLLALKGGGEAIGWGFQMQSPAFVAAMALLLFVIGLNLSGFFELPVLLGGAAARIERPDSLTGSFFTGVLATLVATPCTAPFMATALGYALTQPAYVAIAVFLALGLGLAFPFLLISFSPRALALMPKPGVWMEHFRQFLAFPLYMSVVWLIWVLAAQTGATGAATALLAMTLIAFILWMKRLFPAESRFYALLAPLLILVTVFCALSSLPRMGESAHTSPLTSHGVPFSTERLEALRAKGSPVFVDATAAWCITCQVNYHSTLARAEVREAFAAQGVTFMVADWTNRNAEITEFLQSFGHSGVPLYVYYPPEGEPRVLPQLLTPEIVLEAIR